MDPRTMLVDGHIDELRQTAAEIRAERQTRAETGSALSPRVHNRLRTALGHWMVDAGQALLDRPAATHGHVVHR